MLSQSKDDEKERSSTLRANKPSMTNMSDDKLNNLLTNEQFAIFVRKFRKFMKKNNMQAKGSSLRKTGKKKNHK